MPTEPKKSLKSSDEDDRRGDDGELFLERKFAEEFLRNQKIRERESVDSRLRFNNEKLEYLEQKLNEIVESRLMDYNEMASAINFLINRQQETTPAARANEQDPAAAASTLTRKATGTQLPLMNKKASTKKSKQ